MSARDEYKITVRCPHCGNTGVAAVSEYERPSLYSGIGRRVDKAPPGFRDDRGDGSDFRLSCIPCGVAAAEH